MGDIEILCKMAIDAECYNTAHVKRIAMVKLLHTAAQFGYSYKHFEETGVWKTCKEIEVQRMSETQVIEMQVVVETQAIETQKKPNACKKGIKLIETQGNDKQCEVCEKRFTLKRKTQRFCSNKCRNDFNNARRNE